MESVNNNKVLSKSDYFNILKLKNSMNSLRVIENNMGVQSQNAFKTISPHWLLGLVEGEGSLFV